MDASNNNILSIIAIVISVGSAIITAVNHTRIRSGCCNRVFNLCQIDIDRTTPTTKLTPIPGPAELSSINITAQ
jgi:hypothetical protein